jgi:hypothetical protein
MNRRRPTVRTRVLRWLLVLIALAGAGVLQGGNCPAHTAALVDTMTATGAAGQLSATASDGHEHDHRAAGNTPQHTHTTVDDCHVQPAPGTAATITGSILAAPTTATRIPAVEAPVPAMRPRLPVAVALTAIGISRI